MPKKDVRIVTTSTTLSAAQSTISGGIRIYLSGTYIPAEAWLDAARVNIVPQPLHGLSLKNSGFTSTSPIYMEPGLYRFVTMAPNAMGPVGQSYEDPVIVA
jgi:hypothetical protein